jgi:hypothetical protein
VKPGEIVVAKKSPVEVDQATNSELDDHDPTGGRSIMGDMGKKLSTEAQEVVKSAV